jgi:uncharacterized membrane protein YbhN (UPF0104 family)
MSQEPVGPVPDAAAARGSRPVARWVGIALAIVAIGFCAYALVRDRERVVAALSDADPVLLAPALLLGAGSMAWLGVLWHRCLHRLGTVAPLRQVVGWYFVGEMGKYAPGGVWQVVGRSELAHRDRGVARSTAYTSTLVSYAAMCLGAALLCGLMSPFLALGPDGVAWAWLFSPAVVLVWVVTVPALPRAALRLGSRVLRRELSAPVLPWRETNALVLWSLPAWVLLGGSSAAVAASLGLDADPLRVALAAVAAWVVGFLAVPVPAGAGVREVVFVSLCGLAAGPAVAVAVLARAVLVVVDAGGGAVALAARRGRRHA